MRLKELHDSLDNKVLKKNLRTDLQTYNKEN